MRNLRNMNSPSDEKEIFHLSGKDYATLILLFHDLLLLQIYAYVFTFVLR